MPYRLLAVVGIGLLLVCGIAQAVSLSDFGSFSSTSYTFNKDASVTWYTDWAATNNHHNGPLANDYNSGGEWFDIEGLYLKVVQPDLSHTILEWAVITSDPGLCPDNGTGGEWTGNFADAPTPGVGAFARQRDGINATGNIYHRNPVIGLDWDANGSLEYGLVLDDVGLNSAANMANQKVGTGALGGMTAGLYSVNDMSAWQGSWAQGIDFGNNVDLLTDPGKTTLVKSSVDSQRIVGIDESSAVGYQPMGGLFQQDHNYIWLGSMDITALGDIKVGALATYGMWCGNDWVGANNTEHFDNTPELGTWALLASTSLMGLFGIGWRRRRSA